ncbi:MAG: phosphatidate cytidylyltransferase [Bacteroidota bacterium]
MSMNWSVFRTRALTAFFFVAIMLAGLLWNEWSFFVLFSLVHAGCWTEYHQLNNRILPRYAQLHTLFTKGLLLGGWSLSFFCYQHIITNSIFESAGNIVGGIGLVAMMIGGLLSMKAGVKSFFRASIGLIYLSLSFALLMHIRSGALWMNNGSENGSSIIKALVMLEAKWIPLILIGAIWINDTMAYIVGSFIGKTPLSSVSPKKTWEGTIGGIILSVVVGWISGYVAFSIEAGKHFAAIALIAAIAGTFGDLLESKLKRLAGVKDSGTLMPGHGGFLDRFDSLLIATPFVWMYLWLMV